ncbi:TetR family transcriptional regulator [Endozoicomonas sp. OPT23]|uniref:TetR/AcrR family transcriptional regulator n=1 Tax=Endozoicomonas sp. OPT23 TaxID=2072845 RepID=UPI00129B5B60|nr:TetR/AcrR family transcriptional regulator [Endozoicomonas sp. OPT23]MRI33683.1 TetR family transcriptional regulator [Endozoicomonas sp. OPT23]
MTDKNKYHHGDLQQKLLNEAALVIAEKSIDGLSMRGLADRLGVSRTAAYHHFKDKNGLLCAIAEDGFRRWQAELDGLLSQLPESMEIWFEHFSRAYLDFATESAEHYDLMFGRPIWKHGQPTESLRKLSYDAFQSYVEFVERCQQKNLIAEEQNALRLAQVSWGTLHGLCRLINDGIYIDRDSVEDMCKNSVRLFATN